MRRHGLRGSLRRDVRVLAFTPEGRAVSLTARPDGGCLPRSNPYTAYRLPQIGLDIAGRVVYRRPWVRPSRLPAVPPPLD